MNETKTFTRFEKSQIINTAKVLKGFFAKKDSLEKKINELRKEMLAIDEQQKRWEAPIMDLLGGHRLEEVVEYKRELQSNGKYATKIALRYPDSVLPPVTDEPECPVHEEDTHADTTEFPAQEEPAAAAQTDPTEPDYDSAGFSTEDGLQEGESPELMEQAAADSDSTSEEDPFSFD